MFTFLLVGNVLFMVALCGAQTIEPSFITEPRDRSVIFPFGSNDQLTVTLSCVVSNIQPGQMVVWYKSGAQISQSTTVYSIIALTDSRYSVIESGNGQYTSSDLRIQADASHAEFDSGPYTCAVKTSSPTPVMQSSVAYVRNYVSPQTDTLECTIGYEGPNDLNVIEGTQVDLTCSTDSTGVPKTALQWRKLGIVTWPLLTTSSGYHGDNGYKFIQHHWIATKEEYLPLFSCTSYHPAFQSNKTCQLGPFNVQYKPSIQIMSSSQTVSEKDTPTTFTCDTEANPAVEKYEWTLSGNSRFTLESDNIQLSNENKSLSMTGLLTEDNGEYTVTCTATNAIGTSTASVILVVSVPPQMTTVTMKTTSTGNGINITQLTSPKTKEYNSMAEVQTTNDGIDGTTKRYVIAEMDRCLKTVSNHFSSSDMARGVVVGVLLGFLVGTTAIVFVYVLRYRRRIANRNKLDGVDENKLQDSHANIKTEDNYQTPVYTSLSDDNYQSLEPRSQDICMKPQK